MKQFYKVWYTRILLLFIATLTGLAIDFLIGQISPTRPMVFASLCTLSTMVYCAVSRLRMRPLGKELLENSENVKPLTLQIFFGSAYVEILFAVCVLLLILFH